ncbi:MAG: hypothetical protein ACYC6F_19005 [Longimicrobiales bacterium]
MNTFGTAHQPPDHSPWRAWAHLGVLSALAAVVELASKASAGGGAANSVQGVIAELPEFYFGILPVLLAVALGMLPFSREAPRQGITLAVVVTVVMVALDLLGGGAATTAARVALQAGGVVAAARPGDYTSVPLLGTALALLRGDLVLPLVRSARYAAGDPFLVAAFAVIKAGHLCLPLILTGMVLGVQAWVADRVTFRRPIDATVARIVLAWVFAPAAFYLMSSWSLKLLFQTLFGSAALLMPLLPFGVFAIVGAIGLRTAVRVARWVD